MKHKVCRFEKAVLEALRSGEWKGSVAAHAAGCRSCDEMIQLARWMKELADTQETDGTLPSAQMIWFRAEVLNTLAIKERAVRPLILAEALAQGVGVLVPGAWFTRNWPEIQGALSGVASHLHHLDWLGIWL